jgi:hypothetical protein
MGITEPRVVHLPHMTAAKETTLKEVGEMLTHVVRHMASKEDVRASVTNNFLVDSAMDAF